MLARFVRARNATAAVEFALIVPVMIAMAAGSIELGRAFQAYNAVNRLASQYAFVWSDCYDSPPGNCLTEISSYTASATLANIAPQLITNNINLRMFQVVLSGSTVTVTYAYPSGQALTAAEQNEVKTNLANGQTGVVVSVSYVHQLIAFSTLMGPVIGTSFTIPFTVVQAKS